MHLCRSSSNVPCLPSFLEMLQNAHVLVTFDKVHNPLRLPRETISEPPKVARTCGVLYIFDFEMCLRAKTACTFSTSQLPKVVRTPSVLYILTWKCASRHNGVHFFDISTSKSAPSTRCFVHFDLANVLRATTACNFSSLLWPAGSAPRRFSEPTFRPSGTPNHWKNTVCRDFPTFSRICIFFLLTLSLLLFFLLIFLFPLSLPCSAFHLSILSEV